MKRRTLLQMTGALLAGTAVRGWAQYAERPVRLIVPFPPGGGSDILARNLAPKLSERLRQEVFVENRAGANGAIGFQNVASAPGDGYTLLLAHLSGLAVNPVIAKVGYDPIRDFTPIAILASTPSVLIAGPAFPAGSVKELIELANSDSRLTYGTPGTGNPNHIAGELFQAAARIRLVHAPYKGAALVMNDLMGGHLPLAFVTLPAALPLLRGGKIKAFAVTADKRSTAAPQVPTMAEAGLQGAEYSEWLGLLAPAGVPNAMVTRLAGEIDAALRAPDIAQRLADLALEPKSSTPESFTALIRADIDRLGKVIRQAGIKAD